MDLIHPNRLNAIQLSRGQAFLNKPFHRAIHRFPAGQKHLCGLSPAQPPSPAGQKTHHGASHRTLSVAPRNVLDHHPMLATLDATRCVTEVRRNPPQWNKRPAAFRQSVIARRWPLALRAAPTDTTMWLQYDVDPLWPALVTIHLHLFIHEAHKTLNSIQDGL